MRSNRNPTYPDFVPRLPTIDAIDQIPLGAKLLLAKMAYQCLVIGEYSVSHRYLSMEFNRTQRKSVAKWIRKLEESGFIRVVKQSEGRQANTYGMTNGVYADAALQENVRRLACTLFGDKGLLSDWLYPATWGYGCLNLSGTLLLSALIQINAPVAFKDLLAVLAPLVHRDTAKRNLVKLSQSDIIVSEETFLRLHDNWEDNLMMFIQDNPAGLPRLTAGNQVRQREWSAILAYMTAGQITEIEMIELRKLPCVICAGPSNEQEHFPPQRFFNALSLEPEIVNISPICQGCNPKRSGFIRSLPISRIVPFTEYFFPADSDLSKIRACGIEHQRRQFEKAFKARDKEAALSAINTALSLSMTAGKLRLAGSSKRVAKKRVTLVDSIGIEKPLT